MFFYKKIIAGFLFLTVASAAFADNGIPIFSITPFTTTATVTSNGQATVGYTVTNNASVAANNITINLSSNPAGAALSLVNDNCTGQTIAARGTCKFAVSISGRNISSSFTIRPKVCAYSGNLCANAVTSPTINYIQHSLPTRAYEVVFSSGNGEQLVGINTANTSDIIRATISEPGLNGDGPLAISPSGNKVYVSHEMSDGSYDVLVFDVTANSLTQSSVAYSLSYDGMGINSVGQFAIAPDGNTLYVTNYSYNSAGYPVYRIDLTDPNTATAVTGLTDATSGRIISQPFAMAVSPDGATVYIANAVSGLNDVFSFPNSIATTEISNLALATDFSSIKSLFISPDGRTLYLAGQLSTSSFPATINKYDVANNFNLTGTFSPDLGGSNNVISATLSPDNSKIFAVLLNTYETKFFLFDLDTATMTAPAGIEYPYNIVFFIQNFNFLSYVPDGSAVVITNYGSTGGFTGFLARIIQAASAR